MTCYHPLIRVCKEFPNIKGAKSKTLKIIGNLEYGDNFLEYFQNMQSYVDEYFPGENIKYQRIPCGKCIGCRLDYSKNGQPVASWKLPTGNKIGL